MDVLHLSTFYLFWDLQLCKRQVWIKCSAAKEIDDICSRECNGLCIRKAKTKHLESLPLQKSLLPSLRLYCRSIQPLKWIDHPVESPNLLKGSDGVKIERVPGMLLCREVVQYRRFGCGGKWRLVSRQVHVTSDKCWLKEIMFFFSYFYMLMTFIIRKTGLLLPGTFCHPIPFSQVVCYVATFWLRIDIKSDFQLPFLMAKTMKLRHVQLPSHEHGLMQQLRGFWIEGHLCDVILKSIDGRQHPAHRVLLSAASVAFKTLLCAPFREVEQIQHGQPIELAATGDVVKAFLDYLYGGEPEIAALDAVELLRLASAYEVKHLATAVESNLFECLDSSLALQVLVQSTSSGFQGLRELCEELIASDFQNCSKQPDFLELSARQLQHIVKRDDVKVTREEDVLEGLFRWGKAYKDRAEGLGFLLSHVDFPSLSTSNLQVLKQAAQSLGPNGDDLDYEVKKAMTWHRKQPASQTSNGYHPKRRCLRQWHAVLGARPEKESWKKVSPFDTHSFNRLIWHRDTLFLCDGDNHRIVSWKPGESTFLTVAGTGASVTGFNQLSGPALLRCFAISPKGEICVAIGCDERSQLISFQNTVGKLVLETDRIHDLCCSPNGTFYVLQADGKRVQKLVDSKLTPVISSEQLPKDQQFVGWTIRVSKEEVLFIQDRSTRSGRILRVCLATLTVSIALDCCGMDCLLGRFFVTPDERLFITTGRGRGKILGAHLGEKPCMSELNLNLPGPMTVEDVVIHDGCVSALVFGRESGVYQYIGAEARRLQLDA